MWKGSSALGQLDTSLKTLRNDVVRLDFDLKQLSQDLTRNERHRLQLLKQIAKVRLNEIDSGSLDSSINAADRDAEKILEQRSLALSELEDSILRMEGRISDAETARADLLAQSNLAEQQLVELEDSVQKALQTDQGFLSQFEAAQRAESIAEEAINKVEQANSNLAEKAAPYQTDELFMYLWRRGFGTTEYRGRLFARFMDGWVARLINYHESRVNYWNLTEIPKRLQAHAEQTADAADSAHQKLQDIERQALADAGKPDLEAAVDTARQQLDAHDDSLEALEHALDDKLNERARFLAGDDRFIQQCLSRLSQSLEVQGVNQLRRYVRDTASPTDDALVIELQQLQEHMSGAKEDLGAVRELHDGKLSRLRDLESVRKRFKQARFDDVRSGFGNKALIASVLGQFLQGLVNGSDLWRVIKRNQRYRHIGGRPDFGSGALGEIADVLGEELLRQGRRRRSRHRTTWNWPRHRGGTSRGGGFRFPSAGGGGRGGFKTGGGF